MLLCRRPLHRFMSQTVAVLPRARPESSGLCCSPRARSVSQRPHRPAGVTELRSRDLDGSTGTVHPPPRLPCGHSRSASGFTPRQGLTPARQAPARAVVGRHKRNVRAALTYILLAGVGRSVNAECEASRSGKRVLHSVACSPLGAATSEINRSDSTFCTLNQKHRNPFKGGSLCVPLSLSLPPSGSMAWWEGEGLVVAVGGGAVGCNVQQPARYQRLCFPSPERPRRLCKMLFNPMLE